MPTKLPDMRHGTHARTRTHTHTHRHRHTTCLNRSSSTYNNGIFGTLTTTVSGVCDKLRCQNFGNPTVGWTSHAFATYLKARLPTHARVKLVMRVHIIRGTAAGGSARPGRLDRGPRPGLAQQYVPVPCGRRLARRPRKARSRACSAGGALCARRATRHLTSCTASTAHPLRNRARAGSRASCSEFGVGGGGAQNCSILCGRAGVGLAFSRQGSHHSRGPHPVVQHRR